MKILSLAILTVSVLSNLALPAQAQTYEQCMAAARNGVEQRACAMKHS